MKQFFTIFKFELKNYMKNKSFIGVTLFLIVAIVAVMFFPRISSLIKNDGEGESSADKSGIMLVSAEDEELALAVKDTFEACFPEYEVRVTEHNEEAVKELVNNGEAECAFYMKDITSYVYYVETLSIYDTNSEMAAEALRSVRQLW